MAISQLESPKFKAVYAAGASNGTPGTALANGRIFVTTTGGTYTNASDRHTVYDSKDSATRVELTRDSDGAIALDAAGELAIWFDGTVDIRVEDSANALQYTLVGIDSSPATTVTGNDNLVQNGSFETDTGDDGSPDNWTLAPETSATIAIDSTSGGQNHGVNGLKFTAAGSGGGTATSSLFSVPDGYKVNTSWSFKQDSAATGTYSVILEFYDYNGDATSNVTVWSSTTGAPTAWTRYRRTDGVPSGSTQAKIRLTGLGSGGTDETGSCWFDDIKVSVSDTEYTDHSSPFTQKNVLVNGDFIIAQRGTPFNDGSTPANNDGNYTLDRWIYLTDTTGAVDDTADISRDVVVIPDGGRAAIKLDVETANRKFGIVQIVENKHVQRLINGKCSLSFKARVSTGATISGMRAAVLAWNSTADSVTSDVVDANNWNGAGTDPTLAANWAYENTPSTLTLTDSWQTFKIEGIDIDTSSTTNVAVFLWSDDVTTTAGDFLYISEVQLEEGKAATEFEYLSMQEELLRCYRYYWQGTTADDSGYRDSSGALSSMVAGYFPYPVEMRVAPTEAILTNPTYTNCASAAVSGTIDGLVVRVDTSGAGRYRAVSGVYEADAEL